MKKTILITGASGNLGKACVSRFAKADYQVVATVTSGRAPGFDPADNVQAYEADLTDESSVNQAIEKILLKSSTLDAAVLLVGGFAPGGISETDGALLKKMYTLNFETAYYVARPVFQQMQKQNTGGRIIFVGARPALKASDGKNLLAYALSKSLLFKLAEFLNAEGAKQNIVTTVIVPSTIDTPENRKAMPKADFASWVKPEAIAETIAFITSADASVLREPVFKLYGNA